MKQFVVAYLSLFDGELKQYVIQETTALDAMLEILNYPEGCETEDDVYEYAANTDSFISAIEI